MPFIAVAIFIEWLIRGAFAYWGEILRRKNTSLKTLSELKKKNIMQD